MRFGWLSVNLLDGAKDHRRGPLDGPAHQVPGAVAMMDLGEAPVDRHGLAVRAGRHVTVGQHGGKPVRGRIELQAQDVGKPAFLGFDDDAGVMGDEPAQRGVGVLGVAQVPGAIEWVQTRYGQTGWVADVVQPRGGFQEIGARSRTGARLRARAATPWTCAQRRGTDSWRSVRARCSAQGASAIMRPRLSGRNETFTDLACRLKTSCDASVPVIRNARRLQRGDLSSIRDFAGLRRQHPDQGRDHRPQPRPGGHRVPHAPMLWWWVS